MEENHLVVIPGSARIPLFKYCDKNKIKYKVINQKYFPDGTPGGCSFRGIDYITHVVGFESKFTKDELYALMEEIIPASFKN